MTNAESSLVSTLKRAYKLLDGAEMKEVVRRRLRQQMLRKKPQMYGVLRLAQVVFCNATYGGHLKIKAKLNTGRSLKAPKEFFH